MDKTLNDVVEGFFKGLVFIAVDTIASLFRVCLFPRKGAWILSLRLRSQKLQQVRPLVFLALTTGLAQFALVLTFALSKQEASVSPGLLFTVKRIYEFASDKTELRSTWPEIAACILCVTVLHGLIKLVTYCAISSETLRIRARSVLAYVAGAQVVIVGAVAATMLVQFGQPLSPISTTALAYAIVLPALNAWRLTARQSGVQAWLCPGWVKAVPRRYAQVFLISIAMDVAVAVALAPALVVTWIGDSIERYPYRLSVEECNVFKFGAASGPAVSVEFTMTNFGKQEATLYAQSFFISLDRGGKLDMLTIRPDVMKVKPASATVDDPSAWGLFVPTRIPPNEARRIQLEAFRSSSLNPQDLEHTQRCFVETPASRVFRGWHPFGASTHVTFPGPPLPTK